MSHLQLREMVTFQFLTERIKSTIPHDKVNASLIVGDAEDTVSHLKEIENGGDTLLSGSDTVKVEIKQSAIAGKETKNAVFLSISFLSVFTSYMAIQNLQGSLNDEESLGVISLGVLYGASILSGILAPLIVTQLGVKRVIMYSFIGHLIYTASNFYPSFATLIPSSVIIGIVTGPLWSCQGIYMTVCAVSYSQRTGTQMYASLSRFNGIFWAIFDLSNIIGNLVSSFVLYQSEYNITVGNSSAFCGVNDCPDSETQDKIADPEFYIVYILLSIFLVFVAAGIGIVIMFLSPIESQFKKGDISVKESLLSWFKVLQKTDMKYLIPFTCYLAIAEEVCFVEVTKSYISCPIGIENVGYVMMVYGISTSLSSFVLSRVTKYTKRHILCGVAGAEQLAIFIWMCHWVPTEKDTIIIYVLLAFWGLGDGVWKTQINAMLGEHFPGYLNSVFAVSEGFKSIAFTAAIGYSSLMCVYTKVIITICFLTIGLLLYYFVEVRFIRKQKYLKADKTTEIMEID
ncbi:protein unc-93 homolog A-like [Haliotis rubra]|uniref:protein unc-93 homolog A-like n=1 Tax=Haliotis rubra TaxID=36100 RepID=UPI001EE5DC00|nr:protein unc-93 homolog A-like [Haliotis rubra]